MNDPLFGNLSTLPRDKWKNLRGNLSPSFTSGKLKAMFSTVVDCGASLQTHLEELYDKGESLDVHDIAARYTTNVSATILLKVIGKSTEYQVICRES